MKRVLRSTPLLRRALIALAVFASGFAASTVIAQAPSLAGLDRIEAGLWDVRSRDADGGHKQVCIENGRALIQIRHPRDLCRSFVVEDSPTSMTVHYTCPGNGYGRTHIRVENEHLAQIETQGISAGLPFDFSAEARRIGSCRP
ncbi:DUF3617 domain-containing protein [Novosphingobium lentum]|uniref:DUF3617 domain-containing protein n=1 Tax=Novosphingobium lentum TaxID=145287 RepID=UPI000A7EEB01|nr:hypothetical protein [Novosphingobium lentum]